MVSLSNGSVMQLLMLATSLIYIMHTVNADPVDTKILCPVDLHYTCVRTCFGRCDTLNSTTEMCTKECNLGCDCKDLSYVLAYKNANFCVLPCACKVSCPENMHFEPCLRKPEPTCNPEETVKEEVTCSPRCVCNDGYVRNGNRSDRKCIKLSDCPSPTN
ncbi:alpha-tectorin-like [Mixophyes fleayi]|uniref:alpha-tectorin-like n=1 Tax=Mixophyes fleayi TaxID=3061075 RepID=UPI003F4DF6C9